MKFTSRGLIVKSKGKYCKSWEDLFEIKARDTIDKKKRFKSKYKNNISMIKFEKNNRRYVYMVANQEIAKNKVKSDLQKIADGTGEFVGNKKLTKMISLKEIVRVTLASLSRTLDYITDGEFELFDGYIIDADTGEIVVEYDEIFNYIDRCINESGFWTRSVNDIDIPDFISLDFCKKLKKSGRI